MHRGLHTGCFHFRSNPRSIDLSAANSHTGAQANTTYIGTYSHLCNLDRRAAECCCCVSTCVCIHTHTGNPFSPPSCCSSMYVDIVCARTSSERIGDKAPQLRPKSLQKHPQHCPISQQAIFDEV